MAEVVKVVLPPVSELARAARHAVKGEEWGMPAQFITLHWRLVSGDGYALRPGSMAVFTSGIEPEDYPEMMARMAVKAGEEMPDPACAYLFSAEGWGVMMPEAGASDEEKARFERDRRMRLFHTRADRQETKTGLVADLAGRCCMATRHRGTSLVTESTFCFSDDEAGGNLPAAGGNLPAALTWTAMMMGASLIARGQWDGNGAVT